MDEIIGCLDPPAQLVPDIRRFGRDCLEMGYDGIAAVAELGASLKDSNPPNSRVQTWPAVLRETISILQHRVLLDPISALRHVIRQTVR
eukprot:5025134-Prymnesium_polylepis.1